MKSVHAAIILLLFPVILFAQEPAGSGDRESVAADGQVFESKEIIVRDRKDQAGVVSIITDKEVKNSTKTDLVNVISQQVPSFSTGNNRVMGFGVSSSGAAVISIRGMGKSGWGPSTGVPFLVNGLDTTTSIMGHPVADIFTMKNIDRVEVLHGPQPVLYGSGALGGVVNIITKRQETDGYRTELSASYGSHNTTDDYVLHQGKSGIFDYGVSYNLQRTDGHREQTAPNGAEVTSAYQNQNGTARFGLELGRNWYAGMNAFVMKEKIHDPGPEGAPTNKLETFDILRDGISLNILNRYEKFDGMLHVFYNNGHHEAEQEPLDTDSYEHDDTLYGARVAETAKLFPGSRITVGAEARRWGGTSKNPSTGYYFVDEKYLTEASLFGLAEQRLFNAVTVSGGARYTDNSEFGGFASWQGGLIVNPTDFFKIHASAARGFSLPNLRQLYIKMFPAEVPNPGLEAEIFMSYDAGIEITPVRNLVIDVTGYRVESRNKIVKATSTTWANADEFDYNGLEATAKYLVMEMIGIRAGYSFIDNEYDCTKLAYVPRHRAVGGISLEKYGIFAGIDGEYVREIWADTAGAQELSNYTVLNAKLAYAFLERYRAFINLNNITDREYETYWQYPMPGFTVLGGLSVTL